MNKTGSNEFDGILHYLGKMTKVFLDNTSDELNAIKSKLEKHTNLSSKPKGFRDEMEKCRVVAGEWISLHRNQKQIDDIQQDILNESVYAFFLVGNDDIVGYQKNFFLLSMVEELLEPMVMEQANSRKAILIDTYLRRKAREQNLLVRCQNDEDLAERLWYFSSERSVLQSCEDGLGDGEAIKYLITS